MAMAAATTRKDAGSHLFSIQNHLRSLDSHFWLRFLDDDNHDDDDNHAEDDDDDDAEDDDDDDFTSDHCSELG